jgi:hypothetical protein
MRTPSPVRLRRAGILRGRLCGKRCGDPTADAAAVACSGGSNKRAPAGPQRPTQKQLQVVLFQLLPLPDTPAETASATVNTSVLESPISSASPRAAHPTTLQYLHTVLVSQGTVTLDRV